MVILTQILWKTLGCEEKEYKSKKKIWNPTKAAIAIWYYNNYNKGQKDRVLFSFYATK